MTKLYFGQSQATTVGIGVVLVVLWAAWVFARYSDLTVAWGGFSPELFVVAVNQPQLMVGDFPSGAHLYTSSSFMWLYVLADRFMGIEPALLRWGVIGLEVSLAAAMGLIMARTFVRNPSPVITFAVVVLVAFSDVREPDLGRWGAPLYLGLYYTAADFLRVIGIVLILHGRLNWAALLLGLAFTVHPTMGLMGTVFAGVIVLANLRQYKFAQLFAAAAIFLTISIPWALYFIEFDISDTSKVAASVWIDLTRMMNFHFFPWEYGLFGSAHGERLFPLLACFCLCLAYWASPPSNVVFRFARPIFVAMLVAALFTMAGVFISVFVPVPELIKLALQRMSDLILLFATPVVAAGLIGDMTGGRLWRAGTAILVIATAFLVPRGLPLGIAALVFLPVAVLPLRAKEFGAAHLGLRVATIGIGILILVYWLTDQLADWQTPAYFGVKSIANASLFDLMAILALGIAIIAGRLKPQSGEIVANLLIAAMLVLSMNWIWKQRSYKDPVTLQKAVAYKQIQDWARLNTSEETVFMPDPTHYYGWRAYSHRPSFGNVREWLMSGWFYASDADALREGKMRFSEFDIPLEPFVNWENPLDGYFALHYKTQEKYYSQPRQWFEHIAAKYGVRYFVFHKDRAGTIPVPVVFENEHFTIGHLKP